MSDLLSRQNGVETGRENTIEGRYARWIIGTEKATVCNEAEIGTGGVNRAVGGRFCAIETIRGKLSS